MTELVAFAGYARSGKDTAAGCLIDRGWTRRNFGDIIKGQVDMLVHEHLGFSAYTELDDDKARIRGLLEQWGEANYEGILIEYLRSLTPRTVNTRLVRLVEACAWVDRGGIIIWIDRPGCRAATGWEDARGEELRASGMVKHSIYNDSSVEALHAHVLRLLGVS